MPAITTVDVNNSAYKPQPFILSPRLSDAAILTGSATISGAGVSNLQNSRPRLVWQSASDASGYIVGDFGSAKTIDTLVLGWHTAGITTVQIRLATSEANLTSSPGYNSSRTAWASLLGYADLHSFFGFPSSSYRWFRIDVTNPGSNPLRIGRLMLGRRVEPAVGVSASSISLALDETTAETVDTSGGESPRRLGPKRSLSCKWGFLTRAENDLMNSTMAERGSSGDVTLVLNRDDVQYPEVVGGGAEQMTEVVVGRMRGRSIISKTEGGAAKTVRYEYGITVSEMAPIRFTA